MRNLLKAMGFWIWGLLAIGLAASVANIGYRWVSHYHASGFAEEAPKNGDLRLPAETAKASPEVNLNSPAANSVGAAVASAGARARLEAAEHTQDTAGEIYYGQELYYQREATTEDLVQLVSRITLAQGCAVGLVWANRAIEYVREPSVELYTAKSGCAKDRRDAIATAVELIKLTNDSKWWRHWVELNVQGEKDFWVALAYFRVGDLVGALSPDLMSKYADLLDRLKLYGEGHRFIQRAMKALSADHSPGAESDRRNLELFDLKFTGGASADARRRNELLDAAHLSPEVLAQIGALSYGAGNFESAITELTAALPGLPTTNRRIRYDGSSAYHPEDSFVYLALSQLELKNKEGALKTFSSMLNLYLYEPWRDAWRLYVEELAKSAAAPVEVKN